MTSEEQRSAREGMNEEQLAIFDLLTQPDPILTLSELEAVKSGAKKLLDHIHEVIVMDWHRKADVLSDVDSTIRRVLDASLPEPYTVDVFNAKVELVYNHVLNAYGDDGESVYEDREQLVNKNKQPTFDYSGPLDISAISENEVAEMRNNPVFAADVLLRLSNSTK